MKEGKKMYMIEAEITYIGGKTEAITFDNWAEYSAYVDKHSGKIIAANGKRKKDRGKHERNGSGAHAHGGTAGGGALG